MNQFETGPIIRMKMLVFVMVVGFLSSVATPVFSHGGKTHSDDTFTTFQAVQKATVLYDRLIVSGKLPEVWETGLKTIRISTRNTGNNRETVVQFETINENPNSVYFFFNQDGEYSGSNFSGE
jgi:uncharacterized protein DUF6488